MGLLEILTIVFVVLKLIGVISWSWWLVLLPEIIAIGIALIFGIIVVATGATVTVAGKTIHGKRK